MLRYLETFYRHRLLLVSPLILALAASIGLVLLQSRTYEATSTIRFDSSPDSTLPVGVYVSPADQGVGKLKELLKTRSFCAKVGRLSPLAAELVATSSHASDTVSTIVNMLRGTPGQLTDNDVLDDVLLDTLNRKTMVTSVGPQIVSISFDYTNPRVAAGTVQAIVDQFGAELISSRKNAAQTALSFYKQQVEAQSAQLASADAKVYQYLQAHPGQRAPGAVEDVALTSLRSTDDLARERYRDLLLKYDQAQVDAASLNQPGAGGFTVIDTPAVPYRAKGFLKSAALAGIAGLVAGLVLMLIGLMALTASDTSARRSEEIEQGLGQKVAGSIPRLR
jgi:uncharacterized protein involved in exopolysaccharide biosynthesis